MNDSENREIYDFTIEPDQEGHRLDILLVMLIGDISRTRVQTFIKDGFTTVNGSPCILPRYKVMPGDVIHIDAPAQEIVTHAEGEDIPLDVLYEDDDVLVLNKQAGMVVHPAAGNWSGTIVNAVLGREPEMLEEDNFDPLRPGIVHRLDKDTTGTLVIAKTPKALRKLSRAFAEREVEKIYIAVVYGWPVPPASVVKTWYGRHQTDRKKMMVYRRETEFTREAVTAYKIIRKGFWHGQKISILEVKLHTGRTHQIRVHMSYLGYPLLGDKLYGKGKIPAGPVERQMLHAWKLAFPHPQDGEYLEFEAPVPDDIQAIADEITQEP